MTAMTATNLPADEARPAMGGPRDEKVPLAEAAEDFAALLLEALDAALDAMAHPVPEQYLHLLAARRRNGHGADRPCADGAAARPLPRQRNAAVLHDLSGHLAFEILNGARRYAAILGSIGDYGDHAEHPARAGVGGVTP